MSTMGTTAPGPSSTTEAAKGAATDVAGEAASAASDVKETVKSEIGSVVSDATDRAGAILRTSQDEIRSQVESRAKDLSSTLDSAATQLRSMADAADDPSSAVAQLTRSAADQLRQQSQRLEHGGLEGMVADVKRFASNRPGAFMLGTVAAGFAFGRLAKHANLKQAVDSAKQELTSSGEPAAGSAGPTGPTGPAASTGMPTQVGGVASPRATSVGTAGGQL